MSLYQYKRPAGNVEAIEITQAMYDDPTTGNEFVNGLWNTEPNTENSMFRAVNGSGVGVIFLIDMSGVTRIVLVGDYLIDRGMGNVEYAKKAQFEAAYEAV